MAYLDAVAAANAMLPGQRAVAVAPSDAVDIPGGAAVALNTNVDGVVAVILAGDTLPVKFYLVAGVLHPLAVRRVMLTDTDAGITQITAVLPR